MKSLYYLEILFRWKNFIIVNVFVTAVFTAGISLVFPNWYKATASILPPKEQDILGSAVGGSPLLKGLAGGKGLGMLGRNAGSYNYLAILRSRTSMEEVINKFDLINVYGISEINMDKAVKELEDNTQFETQDDENITIDAYDKDPKRAAEMANYFVEILNATSIRLGTLEAKNNKEFIGRRLDQCRSELKQAEEALKAFQEKKDAIIAVGSNSPSVQAYADLYATKAKKEIEIAVLEKKVAPDNETLKQLKSELTELSRKLSTFPQTGLEGLRLYREVLAQEKILEFLLPIHEEAKIEEQKDVPVLLVLDKAAPPQRKARPQRALIVILVSFLSLGVCIMVVFFFTAVEKIADSQNPLSQRLQTLQKRVVARYRIRK